MSDQCCRPRYRVICPHCGDITEQEFLLPRFTCGACDEPFDGIAGLIGGGAAAGAATQQQQ